MAVYDITKNNLKSLKKGDILNCPYTGASHTIEVPKGLYKLECWGAQGGNYDTYNGGLGGYSIGTLNIAKEKEKIILVTGGQPKTNTTLRTAFPGGFNGGGKGFNRWYDSIYTYGQGGGGASDIRIGQDSLYSRVIVAGGGAGSASMDLSTTLYGGGLKSGASETQYQATQTSAGVNASFGIGADSTTARDNYKYGAGGGGGGWYGGGSDSSASDSSPSAWRESAAGGSGYVYTTATKSNYPSGCTLTDEYLLTEAQTISGNQTFASPTGVTSTGNSGNGYIRITVLDTVNSINGKVKVNNNLHNITSGFVKINNIWKPISQFYYNIDNVWKK